MSKSKELRDDLSLLCSYAKSATQKQDVKDAVDILKNNILHHVEQLENTLALNRIIDERLLEEIKAKTERLLIDTYDEEGNQD